MIPVGDVLPQLNCLSSFIKYVHYSFETSQLNLEATD